MGGIGVGSQSETMEVGRVNNQQGGESATSREGRDVWRG